MDDIVLVSGGFDPIHSGHIKLIKEASEHGRVVILLNSDQWLRNKKGMEFLPFKEREIIMSALKNVIDVISCGNIDETCIDGIKIAINKYKNSRIKFANNNIELLWGIGGNNKSNSSSWILKKWKENN